jgi:streptogramin lyase
VPSGSCPYGITTGSDGALWFTNTCSNKIGRITTSGFVTEYPIPLGDDPHGITAGPDGALWFVDYCGCGGPSYVGRITTSGSITLYPIPHGAEWIAAGPDGALWFTAIYGGAIGRISTSGEVTEFPISNCGSYGASPMGITPGPDGALWFTDQNCGLTGRITTSGSITQFAGSGRGIAVGPDGALWLANESENIGRLTTSGSYIQYSVPSAESFPYEIATGPDGNLWFTELGGNKIGKIIGVTEAPLVSEIQPASGSERGGTEVHVAGSGFSGVTEVRFGATAAEFSIESPTSIVAVAPPGSGAVDVTVSTPGGTSATSSADRFHYSPPVVLTNSPNPSVRGQRVTFTAKVAALAKGAPTPLGTVAFVDGSTTLKVANLNKGTATFSTTALSAGEHRVVAQYSGDASFPAAESEAVIQAVAKASTQLTLASSLNPAPFGSSATLKATVTALAPGAGTPAGTVTFRQGETELDTVQLSGGKASLPLKTQAVGVHEISATYNGDVNDEPSSTGAVAQMIVKAETETVLTSTLNPAPYGSSATLKATVKAIAPGGGAPNGTVTFLEGETLLATLPLTNGSAKLTIKSFDPGSHSVKAVYADTAEYAGSQAEVEQVIVKAATTLTLTSTKNPAPKGSSGTIRATVKSVAPGGGTPPGTVVFREGETVLAVVPLSSGAATYPLKSLAAGTHEVTASYGGSADYEACEDVITQTITP